MAEMSVSELKRALEMRGIDYRDCVEKVRLLFSRLYGGCMVALKTSSSLTHLLDARDRLPRLRREGGPSQRTKLELSTLGVGVLSSSFAVESKCEPVVGNEQVPLLDSSSTLATR